MLVATIRRLPGDKWVPTVGCHGEAIYMVVPDAEAAKEGYLRVIDESGQDDLYPASFSS